MTGPGRLTGPAVDVTVPTAAAMRALGRRLAGLLRAGDLVILIGGLGAGKTTLVQGIGEGLAEDRLEVAITPAGQGRDVRVAGLGARWSAIGDSAFLALSAGLEGL